MPMKLDIRLYYKLTLIALLFIVGLIKAGIIFPLVDALCKPVNAKRRCGELKIVWLRWFCKIMGIKLVVEGALTDQPALWVSNHISWLDIIILGQLKPVHFVAKSDISAWPVVGYLAKKGGTIFIRRGDKQQTKVTAEQIVWLLKQNSTVVAFPEGTTTSGETVLPFHGSLFQPALLVKAMLQPITIEYLDSAKAIAPFIGDDDFIPHLVKMLSLDKIKVRIKFHPCIQTSGKNRHAVSNEVREVILCSLTGEDNDMVMAIPN